MLKNLIRERRGIIGFGGLCCVLAILTTPVAKCQDANGASDQSQGNQPSQPIPAYHSPLASSSQDQGDVNDSTTMQRDTRPLTGAQYISMGDLTNQHSYWQPQVDVAGTADSNPTESPTNANWGGWGSFLGGVDIHQTSGTSQLMLSYTGGGMFSNESDVPSGSVQELGLSDHITFRRSAVSFFDQLYYLPEAGLGFGGVGGLPLTGGGSTGLSSGFSNAQSILSGYGQNLENSSVFQFEGFLTPRSSITMDAGYSLLHFFGNNLLNSGDLTFQGGYNYQMSEHNTLALSYAFSQISYSNGPSTLIDTHSLQATFGRRVTGRLALQIGAGPEFAIYDEGANPSGGTGGGSGVSSGSSTHAYWSVNSALNYQFQRTALGLDYSHGVGAGSGVLAGSIVDMVTGSLTHRMSRTFSSGLTGGYARNSALPIAGIQFSGRNYDYWFAGASLARPLSETVALTLSYQMQYQTSSSSFCIGTSCGLSVVRHLISVGVSWHERPLLF